MQYITDNVIEENVSFSHFKLSLHSRSEGQLLNALFEIRKRITQIIPNRTDLHAKLKTTIDLELLGQMIRNNAISTSDLLDIFDTIIQVVTSLQSEVCGHALLDWYNNIYMREVRANCFSSEDKNTRGSFDIFVYFISPFLEVILSQLDEIQLEVSKVE